MKPRKPSLLSRLDAAHPICPTCGFEYVGCSALGLNCDGDVTSVKCVKCERSFVVRLNIRASYHSLAVTEHPGSPAVN